MVDTVQLGIEVTADTKDLDQLNAKLKQTQKSVKDLSDEQLKLLATQRSGFTGGRSALGELANQELKLRQTAQSAKTLGQEFTSTAQAGGIFSRAFSGIGNLVSRVEAPTIRLSAATRALKLGLQEAGGSLGIFGSVLGTARGGLIGIAAAAGTTFVVAIEKAADNVNKIKDALGALNGSGAQKAFDNIKSAADGARSSLQSTYDIATKLAEIRLSKPQTFVFAPGEGGDLQKESDLAKTLSQGFQLAGDTATEAAKKIGNFLSQVQNAGGLTGEMFRGLIREAPEFAASLAAAFGQFDTSREGLYKFSQQLDQSAKSTNQLNQALNRVAPEVDFLFNLKEPTLAQAFDRAATSVQNFFAAIGNKVGLASALSNISSELDAWISGDVAQKGSDLAKTLFRSLTTGETMAEAFKKIRDAGTGAAQALSGDWSAFGSRFDAVTNQVVRDGEQMIQSFAKARNTLSNNPLSSPTFGAPSGSSGPSFTYNPSGGGSTTPGLFGGVDSAGNALQGYATGGSFVVGGSGGRDTTPVSFMATRGEIVTITPANLSAPDGLRNLKSGGSSYLDVGGGSSQNWMGGAYAAAVANPIVSAIGQSTAAITDAIGNSGGSTGIVYNGGGVSGGGSGLLTSQGVLAHTSNAPAGSAAAPLGSGPVDAYGHTVGADQATYVSRINYNSAIAGQPQPSGIKVYSVNPNYGQFAEGGSFVVGGSGGRDTTPVSFMATKGEEVSISPNRRRSETIGKDRPININVYGAQSPAAFVAAQAQIKRAFGRTFR